MAKKKRKYTGSLAEPLAPVRVGLLMSEQQCEAAYRGRTEAELTKLDLLLDAYSIQRSPAQWFHLCLALAREHVPGFQEEVPRGRPEKWNIGTLWVLAGDMHREASAGAKSQAEAARRLAAKDPWKSFMDAGRWGAGGSDASDSLLAQYKKMPVRYRGLGEGAFKYHQANDTISEWEAKVRDILLNP